GTRGSELHEGAGRNAEGKIVGIEDDGAVALVDAAGTTLLFAEAADIAIVGTHAVPVRLGGVGGFGEGVADGGEHAPAAAVAELGLQAIVIRHAEIHEDVDLTDAAVDRENGTSGIGGSHGADLAGRGAVER